MCIDNNEWLECILQETEMIFMSVRECVLYKNWYNIQHQSRDSHVSRNSPSGSTVGLHNITSISLTPASL